MKYLLSLALTALISLTNIAVGQTNIYYYDALLKSFIQPPVDGSASTRQPITTRELSKGSKVQIVTINISPLYKLDTEVKSLTINYDVPTVPPTVKTAEKASVTTGQKTTPCQQIMGEINNEISDSKKSTKKATDILSAFDQVDLWSKQYALDETSTRKSLTTWSISYFGSSSASVTAIALTINSIAGTLDKFNTDLTSFKTALNDKKYVTCKASLNLAIDKELINLTTVRTELAARAKAMGKTPLYWVVLRDNAYRSQTDIIDMTGDKVSIESKVVKNQQFPDLGDPNTSLFKETFGVNKFWAIDVSAGVVATGLVDHDYYFQQTFKTVATDSIINSQRYKTLKRRNKNEFLKPGIATFVHFRYKASSDFSLGPTLGFTVLSSESPVQYHLGGSLLFGEKQRFAITLGATTGKVTRLSDGFEDGIQVPYSFSDLPTYSSWRVSWFLGLSYNLTSNLK
jgi:hypothetical protein